MSIYETDAILLGWHTSDGPQGHWVKFKLPLAITDGHPFALFDKGPEHGQRFRMTFEAIGNDEKPTGPSIVGSAPPSHADAADSPPAASKHKKPWHDYSPSQQAGMACSDAAFNAWVMRNAPRLQDYLGTGNHVRDPGGLTVASYVRWYCGVSSRSDLDTNPDAAKRWRELYGMFQADTQYGDRR